MGENIEIKAVATDAARQRKLAERIADIGPELLEQTDTFFHTRHGRLKLREFASGGAELIPYERPNRSSPSKSRYSIVAVSEPAALKAVLSTALGVIGVVRKKRYLYLVDQTRIHFDEVENLGDFIELEAVLSLGQSDEDGAAIAATIMRQLSIREEDLLDRAYIDMLCERRGTPSP